MSRVLLIGGNGYIGSSLYTNLVQNHQVESIDLCLFGRDLGYSKKTNYLKINSLEGFDYVVLLANHSSVQMAEYNPSQAWVNNVDGLRHIYSILPVDCKLIYISSGSVYGNDPSVNTEEQLNSVPLNHYDLTKITMDIISSKQIIDGSQVVGLRLGTVNGHSKNLRGDLMLNMMVNSAMSKGIVELSNGEYYRPIMAINDLVRAIRTIIESEFTSGLYNLSSFNSPIRDIAYTVGEKTNVEVVDHGKVGFTYNFQLSTEKFSSTYNFKFTETINDVIDGLVDNYGTEQFTVRKEYDDSLLY